MRTPVDIPVSLWLEIATYCTSPVELLVLARVCRAARIAAKSDRLWSKFTPVKIRNDLYNSFFKRMADCPPNAIAYFIDLWSNADDPMIPTMSFPPQCPVDNIDIALAVARCSERMSDRGCPSRVMFAHFCKESFFANQAILLNPLFYRIVKVYNYDPEHALLALALNPEIWPDIPVVLRSTEGFISRGVRSSWIDLCHVYNKQYPCKDIELICRKARGNILVKQQFWDAIDPSVRNRELYERLADGGFPVWEFVPELVNKDFLLEHCQCSYDVFVDDKEFNLEMIRTGRRPCRISRHLENDPDFLVKVLPTYLRIVWELDPEVISSNSFKELLYDYDFGATDQIEVLGTFPDCLQYRSLAFKAVERNGAWIRCFDRYRADKELLRVAVRTFPEAVYHSGMVWEVRELVEFCNINPQVVWYIGVKFHKKYPQYIVQSLDASACARPIDCYWINWEHHREAALLAASKHEDNIKAIAVRYHNWFCDKELVLAALEVAPGSLLWELSPDLLDDVEIWNKARAKRAVAVITT